MTRDLAAMRAACEAGYVSTADYVKEKGMSDLRGPYMIGCTDTICSEIKHKEITRKDVALSYAFALRSAAAGADKPDWSAINHAILNRWSMSALEFIKARAVKLAKGEIQP